MDIALNKDFEIIKKASSTVLCNELSRCVYEGYKKSSKRNYKVTDKMISIFKFLYKVRIATKDQINRYLTLNGYTNVSEEFLNILNMKYGTLSYIDCKNDKTTRVYAPAVGMLYILDKYTSLEINENTDEYVFQQNINNSFINKEQSEILKGIILTELYLDIIQNSVNEVLYLENRVTIKQFIKDDIDDEEVLGAIRWHTTGKPNMNLLEKIVYVADYIEPRRDKAPNLKEIRKLAFMDLDLALLKILEDTLGYLGDSPEEVDSMTRETYEYYKAQIKG